MKSSFIQLWQLLGPLYMRFHKKLHRLGLCTEGLQQRMAVEAARSGRAIRRRYAFVGFSTVTKAEFALMDTLRKKVRQLFSGISACSRPKVRFRPYYELSEVWPRRYRRPMILC